MTIAPAILDKFKSLFKSPVILHEPTFAGNEKKYLAECVDSTFVSSVGPFVTRFEQELAGYTGVKFAVATANGTAALHTCLLLAGVKRDDEVLVPALTFVATANAVAYCNAVPHFVDSSWKTLGICPEKLADYLGAVAERRVDGTYNKKTNRKISACIPMHTFGHPVDMDPLVDLCNAYTIPVIEDAAEALGSLYKGKHIGNAGALSALSFNGNKIITTGGGGAILTNDEALAKKAKHLTTTAKVPHAWEFDHDMVGYNYRMPNINAALGCAQLEQLDKFIDQKRRLAQTYRKLFLGVDGVTVFEEPAHATSNYWLNCLVLSERFRPERDTILKTLNDNGVMMRPCWKLMNQLSMYKECPSADLHTATEIVQSVINIPSSSHLISLIKDRDNG